MNKFDQIAANKKQAELAKQNHDVKLFAQKVADQVLVDAKFIHGQDELAEILSGLSTAVAGAIVLSNENIDTNLKDNFSQLLLAVKDSKPDNTGLSREIGQALVSLETKIGSMELSPVINLETITVEQLQLEVGKILARLPENNRREITIAYEEAKADKYINVRLTDGISFYKATGGVSGGGTNISPIKGFALGEYDTINATYPSASSERYTYSLSGQTTYSILVTYTDTTKANILSVVRS